MMFWAYTVRVVTRYRAERRKAMKCPHCQSLMEVYDQQVSDISKVSFYRCTVCVAEHVSSTLNTVHRINARSSIDTAFFGFGSHKSMPQVL
jgi:transcription elongation factor Elf1